MNSEQELMEIEDNHANLLRDIELGYLEVCHNCGNIWDGNAQCPCGMDYEILKGNQHSRLNEQTKQISLY